MTRDMFRTRIEQMIEQSSKKQMEEALRLYDCGGIDPDAYNENELVLPKIIYTVVLENEAFQYSPARPTHKKEVRNLRRF